MNKFGFSLFFFQSYFLLFLVLLSSSAAVNHFILIHILKITIGGRSVEFNSHMLYEFHSTLLKQIYFCSIFDNSNCYKFEFKLEFSCSFGNRKWLWEFTALILFITWSSELVFTQARLSVLIHWELLFESGILGLMKHRSCFVKDFLSTLPCIYSKWLKATIAGADLSIRKYLHSWMLYTSWEWAL